MAVVLNYDMKDGNSAPAKVVIIRIVLTSLL